MTFNLTFIEIPICLFFCSCIGFLWYKYDVIRLFIALELLILSSNYIIVASSFIHVNIYEEAQAHIPIVLAVAACEAAIGLGLLMVFYKIRGSVLFSTIDILKG